MHNCGKQVLKIDAFREAIRGDKNALLGFLHVLDAFESFFRRELTSDTLHHSLWECTLKLVGYIMSCGDVTAKNDWVEAVAHQ